MGKRKFFVLLLALVMVLGVMSGVAVAQNNDHGEPCEHTFKTSEYVDDEKHFSRCDDCGAEWYEPHNKSEIYSVDNTQHVLICEDCGAEWYEPHSRESGIESVYDEYHEGICSVCGDYYREAHKFESCVCTVCGYETAYCAQCGGYAIPENRIQIDDEYCTVCCNHGVIVPYYTAKHEFFDITALETEHIKSCWKCSRVVYEPHTFENGKCVICGYVAASEPTATPEPSATPDVTATPEPTATAEPGASVEPSETPDASATATAEPSVSPEPTYDVFEGDNSIWTPGSDSALTFHASGDFEKFTGITVDGNAVPEDMYTAVSGSTIVTLKPEYLATLSAGAHNLAVLYTDGECKAEFEITAAATGEPTATPAPTKKPTGGNGDVNIPKTGDTSNMTVWYVVMFVSIAVGIATLLVSRKRKFNR